MSLHVFRETHSLLTAWHILIFVCSELCVPVVQSLGLHKKLKFGRRAAVSGSKEKFNKAKATSVATPSVCFVIRYVVGEALTCNTCTKNQSEKINMIAAKAKMMVFIPQIRSALVC